MPTVVLNAYSKAYPTISNRIRASISLQSSPLAPISQIIDSTPGHPTRIWSFPGLPRDNYNFSLDEIDGSDVVINNLAFFSVVPGEVEGTLNRGDEQIQVGVTPGFNSGLTTVVFDGTGGKPNYIGWDIVPSELTGRGILVEGLDYSWNQTTGTFTLLQSGDILSDGTYYNIHFNPISDPAGNSAPPATVNTDFSIVLITQSTVLTAADFSKKLIVSPTSGYMSLTLPSLTAIPQGRKLMVEVQSEFDCTIEILTGANDFRHVQTKILICNREQLSIYKAPKLGGFEYRTTDLDGNYRYVGMIVSTHDVTGLNRLHLVGTELSVNNYARLYQFVQNLPITETVSYNDWPNNKTKFSLANASGMFRIPDYSGLYERASTSSTHAGQYQRMMMEEHGHLIGYRDGENNGTAGYGRGTGQSSIGWGITQQPLGTDRAFTDTPSRRVDNNSTAKTRPDATPIAGNETRPETIVTNKYVLI